MDPIRKTSLAAGVLYLITFLAIPTLALYGPVREADYIVGAGPDTGAIVAGILEVIVALAGIGTAVVLYPVVKRQNGALAMGFVGSRVLEGAAILVGVGCLLTIVTLRQDGAGAEALVTADALVAMYDRMFLLGQSLMPAVNALLLGSLLYQSRLVPRVIPTLGLIGAPLQIIGVLGVLFDLWGRNSAVAALLVLLIVIWEFSLGVYLVVKGFRPSAVDRLAGRPDPLWLGHERSDAGEAAVSG